jgi:hypothetical protein
MTSETANSAGQVSTTAKLSANPKRASEGIQLFNTIAFSFSAGMSLTDGIRHIKTSRSEYYWIRDFLMTAAWLLIGIVSGLRVLKLKEDKG